MIDKVLRRSYVLSRMEAIAGTDVEPLEETPVALVPDDAPAELSAPLTAAELAEADAALSEAAGREAAKPLSAQLELDDGSWGKPPEERAWIPRDPATSIVQATLEAYLHEHRGDLLVAAPGQSDDRRAGEGADPVATHVLEIDLPEEDDHRRLGGAFEITDIRWAKSAIAMGLRLARRRRPFVDRPADVVELADNARVIAVGDWASGHHRAREVAKYIRREIERGQADGRPVHVIHLGDTYYGGFKDEYEDNFLPHWPVAPGEDVHSWSLNGNHDMNTGGWAYFDFLLKDPRFAAQRQSSVFSIEGKHWQILGLDTAWKDHGLEGGQAEWVAKKRRDNPGRKTMLMSHHQLFSAYKRQGPDIEQPLREAGALDEPIDAWLWGHEHAFVAYSPEQRVRYARLVGNGGIPEYHEKNNKPSVFWREADYFKGGFLGREKWALFGFAVLDFNGESVDLKYVDEWGRDDRYRETLA